MSPASGTGMSPSYPHSEPSPDPMGNYNTAGLINSRIPRPASNSPPLTPNSQNNSNKGLSSCMLHVHKTLNIITIFFLFYIIAAIINIYIVYRLCRYAINLNGSIYGGAK